jgi:hypothetical protein
VGEGGRAVEIDPRDPPRDGPDGADRGELGDLPALAHERPLQRGHHHVAGRSVEVAGLLRGEVLLREADGEEHGQRRGGAGVGEGGPLHQRGEVAGHGVLGSDRGREVLQRHLVQAAPLPGRQLLRAKEDGREPEPPHRRQGIGGDAKGRGRSPEGAQEAGQAAEEVEGGGEAEGAQGQELVRGGDEVGAAGGLLEPPQRGGLDLAEEAAEVGVVEEEVQPVVDLVGAAAEGVGLGGGLAAGQVAALEDLHVDRAAGAMTDGPAGGEAGEAPAQDEDFLGLHGGRHKQVAIRAP